MIFMKKGKKLFLLTAVMCMFISLSMPTTKLMGTDYDTPFTVTAQAAKKKTPAISAKKKTVYYKSTATLKLKNYKGKVKWTTSNKKIAKVSSKGVVTGVAPGKCTITATAGKKKYKCTVTVKDRNVTASASFKVTGGGYFVKGESTATVTVKPKKYNAYKATVTVENAAGDTVYKKTLKKLTKNKKYTFTWNGKSTKGKYVSTGSYRVKVKIGSKVSYSDYLTFNAKNDFADGNGSKTNPFTVQSIAHLKKTVKYPSAYYKQVNDIDFNYTSIPSLFSADQPFTGTYDGAGKAIKNISGTAALFDTVGEKGTIKNVKMVGCVISSTTQFGGVLVIDNQGTIASCTFDKCALSANYGGAHRLTGYFGMVSGKNSGTIKNCTVGGEVSGAINSSYSSPYTAGVTGLNNTSGKVLNCLVKANIISHTYDYPVAAGVVGYNNGLISNCEASGTISGDLWYRGGKIEIAGITIENKGQILSSFYSGNTDCELVVHNSGNIM